MLATKIDLRFNSYTGFVSSNETVKNEKKENEKRENGKFKTNNFSETEKSAGNENAAELFLTGNTRELISEINFDNKIAAVESSSSGLDRAMTSKITGLIARQRELTAQTKKIADKPEERKKIQRKIDAIMHQIADTAEEMPYNDVPLSVLRARSFHASSINKTSPYTPTTDRVLETAKILPEEPEGISGDNLTNSSDNNLTNSSDNKTARMEKLVKDTLSNRNKLVSIISAEQAVEEETSIMIMRNTKANMLRQANETMLAQANQAHKKVLSIIS